MYKKIKNVFLTGMFFISSAITYSFQVDNIIFNQRMDTPDGGYGELYIKNESLEKRRYKIEVLKGNKNDGSKFISLYPKVVTIEPKSKGTLKIVGKSPQGTKEGEYDFKLRFKPISIPTLSQKKDGRVTGSANVSIAPEVEMKGYVGNIDFSKALRFEDIELIESKDQGLIVKGKISNDSFAGIDFSAEASGTNDFFYGVDVVPEISGSTKDKIITLNFPKIKNKRDLKKILFYRTHNRTREVLKEINIDS